MPGVELIDVVKSYGSTVVIPSLSLSIEEGEFAVIVGPSGCGKSTTLRMICGLEPVTSGTIRIRDRDVTRAAPKARDIAMVFQSYALYPHMDVAGNMSFALRLAGVPKAEIKERVNHAAKLLELTDYLDRKPRDLSGGQRQRVAMGRSIVRDAYCFLFDEPLSNLDAKLRSSMRTELALLHKKLQRTMVYVTHDQIEAMTMADRIVIMDQGIVQQIGTPREVYVAPVNLFVAGLIGSPSMNFLNARVERQQDALFVTGDGFKLPVPARLHSALENNNKTEVVAGLRPEHFLDGGRLTAGVSDTVDTQVHAEGIQGDYATVKLEVDVAEYIGSSQFLAARIGQKSITATVDAGPDAAPLGSGRYLFDTNRMYLFDPASGKALAPAAASN